MRYMLDTVICIYAINERPPKVLLALREHHAVGLGVSAITASELSSVSPAPRGRAMRRRWTSSWPDFEVAGFDASAAEVAGQVRSWLASQSTPIGPYDSLIAAHAQALGVTGDQQHAQV